jgi:cellulose biosynthesis protein BcsQ
MSLQPNPTRGYIYTFYSYKGGVGRSMALANVAALLVLWGRKVLILDWDLEAPGIESFFQRWLRGPGRKDTHGLVDLVEAFAQGGSIPWADALLRAHLSTGAQVDILSAGRDDDEYTARLQRIDWETLFSEKKFGLYLEKLRQEWVLAYDFILIDSRTGITDIGGICTIHLPDVVLPLFTANAQSLVGVRDVMLRARRAHANLPLDRDRLLVVPVPARDESNSEYETAKKWRERFAVELEEFFRDWAPKDEKPYDILDRLKVPYFAYWSFGEQLPVMNEDPENPKTLAFSYQLIARLLLSRLDWNEAKQGTAASEAAAEQNVKAAELTLEAARRRTEAHRDAAEREAAAVNQRRRQYLEGRFADEFTHLKDRADYLRASARSWAKVAYFSLGMMILGPIVGGVVASKFSSYDYLAPQIGVAFGFFVPLIFATKGFISRWRFNDQRKIPLAVINVLKREMALFEGSAGPYSGLEPNVALKLFIETTESIIAEGKRTSDVLSIDHFANKLHSEPAGPAPSPPDAVAGSIPLEVPAKTLLATETSASTGVSLRETESAEPYDIFISYRSNQITNAWLKGFIPLLSSWLASLLGYTPRIFFDSSEVTAEAEFLSYSERALRSSRSMLVVITPAYAKSPSCMRELETFAGRSDSAIVPILVQTTEPLPEILRSRQYCDLRDYYFVGGGFTQSPLYVDFQKQVRSLAEDIAALIERNKSSRAEPVFQPK